ncbi:T9SS type A sorting domain-containing protein [Ferruginibacter sp. SUN106]|uniref:T9SS type A sorting domain-containing protein n=1 Tax=Ferruginibacter sp. SUN106 TaxID=2978348 RepID=UPI003D35FD15
MFTNFTSKAIALLVPVACMVIAAKAQNPITSYSQVYSANIKGGTAVLGNTSMQIINSSNGTIRTNRMNDISDPSNGVGGIGYTQYGNDNDNMQFADIDGIAGTNNSTSADLILPAGTNTIKFARLYWGGRILNSAITSVPDTLRKVKIRKGAGSYSNVLAAATSVDQFAIAGTSETVYQAYSDITAYVQSNGAGTFTVADIPATAGSTSNGGRFAGWSIVVAYENPASLLNSVRIYHGYYQVFTSSSGPASVSVTLNNLNVPNNSLSAGDAVMTVMGWEGDGNLGATGSNPEGDFVKVNNVVVSNNANVGTNFWNGSISNNGAYVNTKNPSYANQMGIDIDQVDVGTGYNILPNASSVTLTFGTEADQYFPSYFAFSLRSKDPLVTINKTVTDASANNSVESNEILTYTLTGTNVGPGQAHNVYVVDSLPSNVTYISNSMEVISGVGATLGAQTDAIDAADKSFKGTYAGRDYVKFFLGAGATNAAGGIMNVGETYTVKFKVQGQVIPGSVTNSATSYAYSAANDLFTDVSTAIIGPLGAPLSVKLVSFNATLSGNRSVLDWVTESELNNDHFDVERSEDGIHFTTIGTVKGNGTSATIHNYKFTDDLLSGAAIVYYRLKVVDNNNKSSYSKIVLIRQNGIFSASAITVYPNPFVTDVKVFIKSTKTVTALFRVMAANGAEVVSKKVTVESGNNIIVLNDMASLPKGTYILEVVAENDKFSKTILKN